MATVELNAADKDILGALEDGRATPAYLSDRLGRDRSYINQRLKRMQEHGIVRKVHTGLYEKDDGGK